MITHSITCHILITKLGIGMQGAALATDLTYVLNMLAADLILIKLEIFEKTRVPINLK
jgi:Na+-driven multidrug efflux pump